MRIIYRGGYNKEVVERSMWFEYLPKVSEWLARKESVGLVTLAKPDGYYDERVKDWPQGIEVINHKTSSVEWDKYDRIIIPGSETVDLYNGLRNLSFELSSLKQGV